MKKIVFALALVVLSLAQITPLEAREGRHGKSQQEPVAGVFDYYLLTLSWSPTYCLTHQGAAQCSGKGYGFVLHGLWPQYAGGGWPADCSPTTALTGAERAQASTLFPSPKLVEHEWSKHGTCSGLSAKGYFDTADKAVAAVKIPNELQPSATPRYFTAVEVADLFRKNNARMPEDGVAITCNGPELAEVRVCLSKDLSFTSCGKGVKTRCRAGEVRVPPIR